MANCRKNGHHVQSEVSVNTARGVCELDVLHLTKIIKFRGRRCRGGGEGDWACMIGSEKKAGGLRNMNKRQRDGERERRRDRECARE